MKPLLRIVCFFLLIILASGCKREPIDYNVSGVSIRLAEYRSQSISNLSYNLTFHIPADIKEQVKAEELIKFVASDSKYDLLIDFRENRDMIKKLLLNGEEINWDLVNDHITIPKNLITEGANEVWISFIAGDMSLNRNEEYMYTLLVPDRASTAFPCFDQPNLKATFNLTLNIDSSWTAISNNPLLEDSTSGQIRTMKFGEGKPISTYLFAFSAGNFEKVERTIDGIPMEMLHRETNYDLINSNIDEIFNLHAKSIKWLEDYTGIGYPFDKFGFILIPSFQYGGMEHPGSIYYRATSLLLENNASINQELSRAGLIAHETAHIWFGDLVTMDWFNDVWLKEVFAGFLSDKITNPSFPEINHDLRFLFGRYPAAYSVDRTTGSNPIIQDLENMKNAGSLYGAIIYNKAPVVMKHLEMIMGEELLRNGLREYLRRYSYSNARWDDLVIIFDEMVDNDLVSWSDVWVKEAGMPHLETVLDTINGENRITFKEIDPGNSGRHWPQALKTLVLYSNHNDTVVMEPSGDEISILLESKPVGFIPGFDGITYGFLKNSKENILYLLNNARDFSDPLVRGSIWLNSWENMLAGIIEPEEFLKVLIEQIPEEREILLTARLRGYISEIFWHHLDYELRPKYIDTIEKTVMEMFQNEASPPEKRAWFNTYLSVATSSEALDYIFYAWDSQATLDGLKFSEPDYISMACNLALKQYNGFEIILIEQAERIVNSDRKEEYMFIIQALDSSGFARDEFFVSLKDEENRQHEPWVIKALGYLHHPLYADYSIKYIPESLNLLSEIQSTGDIFFPGQWISTTLSGHHSVEAYNMVKSFLILNPDYPSSLRLKILQSYDHLLRKYGDNNTRSYSSVK